jgi:Kef-type K+ transport system membrane component KefB
VLLLSVLVVAETGGSLAEPLLKIVAFSVLAFVAGRWVMPRVAEHHTRIESPDTRVALVLATALGFAWLAVEVGGLADVTGAFLAGVILSRTDLGHHILEPVSRLGYALFIPLFFIVIGAEVTRADLSAAPIHCAVLVAAAVATKLGGCGLTALLCGESRRRLPVWGRDGGAREIALVVASVGLQEGVVDGKVFSIAVVVTVATTVAAPLLLKASYALSPAPRPASTRPGMLTEFASGGQ